MAKKILVKGTKGPRLMTEAAFKIAQRQFGAAEIKPAPVELKKTLPPEINKPIELKPMVKNIETIKPAVIKPAEDKPKRKAPVKSKSTK